MISSVPPEISLWGLTSGPCRRGLPALRAIPAAAIRIGVHWAGAYGKDTLFGLVQRHFLDPNSRRFPDGEGANDRHDGSGHFAHGAGKEDSDENEQDHDSQQPQLFDVLSVRVSSK